MSKGRLAPNVLLEANVSLVVYHAVGDFNFSEVDLNILNNTNADATISVAISQNDTPGVADYIEDGLILTSGGSLLKRSCEKMSVGEYLIVRSSVAGLSVRVSGKEYI